MRWQSWAAPVGLVAGLAVACTVPSGVHRPEPHAQPSQHKKAAVQGKNSSHRDRRPFRITAQSLTPFVADRVHAFAGDVFRARNGFTLMVIATGWPRDWTRYQVFDRRWRPHTPILQVPVRLEMARGVRAGFLGEAYGSDNPGGTSTRVWVRMGLDGSLHRLPGLDPEQNLRRGDLLFGSSFRRLRAYRPKERRVFIPRLPVTATGSRRDWQMEQDGAFCHAPGRSRSSRPTTWSLGDGHTGRQVNLARLLPAHAYPRVRHCWARQGRLVVLSDGGEGQRDDVLKVHTVDPRRGTATSYATDRRFNPYNQAVLPDGRMVAGTDRPGLMVATDPTNTGFVRRPGPVAMGEWVTVLGGTLVTNPNYRGTFHVSNDAGLTWQTIVLRPGPLPTH